MTSLSPNLRLISEYHMCGITNNVLYMARCNISLCCNKFEIEPVIIEIIISASIKAKKILIMECDLWPVLSVTLPYTTYNNMLFKTFLHYNNTNFHCIFVYYYHIWKKVASHFSFQDVSILIRINLLCLLHFLHNQQWVRPHIWYSEVDQNYGLNLVKFKYLSVLHTFLIVELFKPKRLSP